MLKMFRVFNFRTLWRVWKFFNSENFPNYGITTTTRLWSLQSSHRVTITGLSKACASDEKKTQEMWTLVSKHHSNTGRPQPDHKNWHILELLGKFQMPNRSTAWQLDVDVVVLSLALAVLVENGEALPWAFVFFHIPTKRWWGRHSESCFAHYFTCTYWARQLVHAGDESGHQRVYSQVLWLDCGLQGLVKLVEQLCTGEALGLRDSQWRCLCPKQLRWKSTGMFQPSFLAFLCITSFNTFCWPD